MSILDMASGQNLIGAQDPAMVGGNPAAPSTGWPNGLGGESNQSSSFGSLLYGPTPGSVPMDQGIPAEAPPPVVEAPQQYEAPQPPPSNPDLDALSWHNQGLLRHTQQLESRLAQIKPLEDLLRYDPTAYERMLNALYQPMQPQQPQYGPPAAQAQPEPAAPQFPWEQAQQEQPPAAPPQQPQGFDPRQMAQMNALLLTEAVAPLKHELEQTKVEMAKIHLERQINELRGRYGDSFNPREVVAYAYSNGIQDLDKAFRGVLGERTYQSQFAQPRQSQQIAPTPGPSVQAGGYASAQIPPPAAVPAVPDARVEPTRARAGVPQSSAFPQNFRPRDPHEAANYALHLLREMKQRP